MSDAAPRRGTAAWPTPPPVADERDQARAAAAMSVYDQDDGPRVGDVVQFADGVRHRICELYPGLTNGGLVQTSQSGRWFLGSGHMNHSGRLALPVPLVSLIATGQTVECTAWVFHHGIRRAGYAVDVEVTVRLFTCTLPAPE